jgi:TRAP-type C4-dicarboxylate transport system substrate-binding protein
MTRSRSVWGTAALAGCALVLAGCGTTGATKAGGSAEPVTLRLGTDDGDDAPTAPLIEAFAERVRALSDGALVVDPVFTAVDDDGAQPPDWDQLVAREVAGGGLEMGLVPARAWDVEGVLTLRPLSVPFLVESEEHLDAVVGGSIAADMLAGLESEGVTGLALFPEGMRHLFSFGEALTSPAALAGTTIRASHSDTVWAVYGAWGATADDLTNAEFDYAANTSGAVAGADSTFARASGLPGSLPSVAGNLVTSVSAQTLFVSTEVLDGLSADQGDVLRRAAADVLDDVLAEPLREPAGAAELCGRGGRVVTASESDLAALEAAVRPVYDQLEQDPATAALIADIRNIGNGLPSPEPVPPCEPSGGTASAGTEPDTEGAFPEGTYRYEVTEPELVAAGMEPLEADNHAGIWDWTFADGRIVEHDVRASDGKVTDDEGSYCVLDGRVTVALSTVGCSEEVLFHAAWTLEGRELRFTDVVPGELGGSADFAHALWGSEPLTRID